MQTLPPPVDQLVGKALGQYEVKQLLGHGNVNAIYAAQQQPQNQTVMMTVFTMPETFSLQSRQRFLMRFTQIASALVRLNHPHVLPTYDFGEQFGYPYLITPFVTGGSLARMLRQETRCAPEQVLQILKQIAEGLNYAHQNGMVHGTLKPANILLNDEQDVRIAGFGLANILRLRDIAPVDHQYPHLVSIAGTFLGAPEYIAPEVVRGAPADERSDIYALGIMLFELLTGKPPFTGEDPLAIALQHVQQSVPSLEVLYPDVMSGLDLVVQRAVEPDPAQRFQSVNKLVSAFERVLTVIHGATSPRTVVKEATLAEPDMTMPPTVNWDEESVTGELSHVKPPMSGHMPTMTNPRFEAGNWQLRPPVITNQLAAMKATQGRDQAGLYNGAPTQSSLRQYGDVPALQKMAEDKKAVDPFALWTENSSSAAHVQEPGTFRPDTSKDEPKRRGRRRVVAMLATGVVAAGIVGAGGIGIARFLQKDQPQQSMGSHPTTPAPQRNMAKQQGGNAKQQKITKPTARTPVQAAKPQQPAHTGTVIGMTKQAPNSAQAFKNPADNNDSLLVHLPNGNFVAYERECTHQQVPVDYNPTTQKFVCPLHGSIFDPAQDGRVLQGPAGMPLPPVPVHVNADGTVTVG